MRDTQNSSVAIMRTQHLSGNVERRQGTRLTLTATAEVTELSSRMQRSSRTTDVGPGGCFVDSLVPFPAGSNVHIRIRRGENEFAANGTVAYSQNGLGMGIAFEEGDDQSRPEFDSWMDDVIARRKMKVENPTKQTGLSGQLSQLSAIVDLLQLLVSKGILTEAEGSALARKFLVST